MRMTHPSEMAYGEAVELNRTDCDFWMTPDEYKAEIRLKTVQKSTTSIQTRRRTHKRQISLFMKNC
jgi:hypothetical protein